MLTPEEERLETFTAILATPDPFDVRRRHTVTQPIPEDQKPLLRLDVMWRGLVARGLWSELEGNEG